MLLAALLILALSACGGTQDNETPPDIRYGEDVCDRCLMIINEARYAAAYVTPKGDVRRFDDIGGMVAYLNEAGEETAILWVHDYETEAWLKADEAVYVESASQATPMGFGIIAFAEQSRAEAWSAEQGGGLRSYSEVFE
jgi:copper chaperone NosL